MKTLVLTDIHGCYDEMITLINKHSPDNIIITGDLIDRGPDSYKVVKYCIDNPNVQVCLGNHELMFIEAMKNLPFISFSNWFVNGGDKVYAQTTPEQREEMLEYFKTLPLFIETEFLYDNLPIVISHTAINTFSYNPLEINENNYNCKLAEAIVWSRTQPSKKQTKTNNFFSIFGHTPVQYINAKTNKPILSKKGLNLDTACAYGHYLSGVLLPSMEIVQVPKRINNAN